MAFSLSDLLNPAPAPGVMSPAHSAPFENDPASSSYPGSFAPELFQTTNDVSMTDTSLAAMAVDATSALESSTRTFGQGTGNVTIAPPLLKHEASEDLDASDYPMDGLEDPQQTQDDDQDSQSIIKHKEKKYKKRTDLETAMAEKSTIHSSKNEGQHTDKRYLCYICSKLFTRRRSVRDHINKIHSVKTWEPQRSLEVTVDPTSGEPVESIDDVIARGPPPAPERAAKQPKEKTVKTEREDTVDEEPSMEPEGRPPDPDTVTRVSIEASPQKMGPEAESKPELPSWDDAPTLPAAADTIAPPPPIIGKKRPAPDTVKPLPAYATKKGIAKPKTSTPNKKPKLSHTESVSEKGTPIRSSSATPAATARTPASKLKKQATIVSRASSPVSSRAATIEPQSPTPSASTTPASSNDDGEIFCICRKGDNHTWMIACDGGCDEWFHGNCVNIRERDGDLIDKYICPKCTKTGLQTTWKRMCRRKGCRKPARVLEDPPSKYCSNECGRMFFVELIRRGDPYVDTMKNDQFVVDGGRPKKMRKKRKKDQKTEKATKAIPLVSGDVGDLINSESRLATPAYSEDKKSEYETDTSADEDELPNRGGPLRAGEIRAILESCKTIEQWRDLGRKPDTPPREPDEMDTDLKIEYDDFEKTRLDEIAKEKTELDHRLEILEAREKMMELIKTRSGSITESVKKEDKKMKDPCGFDPRLGWSEAVFLTWYNDKGGKALLETGKVGPPDDEDMQVNDDKKMVNGVDESEEEDDEGGKMPKKGGVCVRNRCPRHKNWAKAQLAEIRFEQDIVKRALRRCGGVERGIRERGVVRAWEMR